MEKVIFTYYPRIGESDYAAFSRVLRLYKIACRLGQISPLILSYEAPDGEPNFVARRVVFDRAGNEYRTDYRLECEMGISDEGGRIGPTAILGLPGEKGDIPVISVEVYNYSGPSRS